MTDHDTDAVSRITALMATHAYAKASAEERARMIVDVHRMLCCASTLPMPRAAGDGQ